jgi:hypothetical protein
MTGKKKPHEKNKHEYAGEVILISDKVKFQAKVLPDRDRGRSQCVSSLGRSQNHKCIWA